MSNNLEGTMVAVVVEKATESQEEMKLSELQEPVSPVRRAKYAKNNRSSKTTHVTRSHSAVLSKFQIRQQQTLGQP